MQERYVHAPGLLWRRIADREILLLPGTSEFVHLDGTALAVWDCFATPTSLAVAVSRLSEAYRGESGDIAADVRQTVDGLAARGLLVTTA